MNLDTYMLWSSDTDERKEGATTNCSNLRGNCTRRAPPRPEYPTDSQRVHDFGNGNGIGRRCASSRTSVVGPPAVDSAAQRAAQHAHGFSRAATLAVRHR